MTFKEFCMEFELTLDDEQKEAVQRVEGPCLVQAVPGSGKTTVLTARLGYMGCCLGIDLDRVLVMTFSKDAAEVMRSRFRTWFGERIAGRPTFCTIHSLAFRIIREYCRRYDREPFHILTEPEKIIKRMVKTQRNDLLCDLLAEEAAAWIGLTMNEIGKNPEKEKNSYEVDFNEIFHSYKKYKLLNRQMDFDDLLVYGYRILKKCPEIRRAFQNRFDHFCVDEVQDSSPIQNEILMMLASEAKSLFLVGDEDQSIYGFRGAAPKCLHDFAESFGEDRVIQLENNYRSSKAVIKAAGNLIRQNGERMPKELKGIREDSGSARVLHWKNRGERDVYILTDLALHPDAAVLARNNESLTAIAFRMFLEGFPFVPSKGMMDYFRQEPVRGILEMLRHVAQETDAGELPEKIRKYFTNQNLIRCLKTEEPEKALYLLLDQMGVARFIKGRWGNKDLCRIYMKLDILAEILSYYPDLDSFLGGVEGFGQWVNTSDHFEGTRLLTCHSAKGMEFEKVYLVDLVDKIFPSCYYITDGSSNEYEEEVRLLYVALTRAKNDAEILQVENYRWGRFDPSTFVKEIEEMMDE